jgi:hypothetical protein
LKNELCIEGTPRVGDGRKCAFVHMLTLASSNTQAMTLTSFSVFFSTRTSFFWQVPIPRAGDVVALALVEPTENSRNHAHRVRQGRGCRAVRGHCRVLLVSRACHIHTCTCAKQPEQQRYRPCTHYRCIDLAMCADLFTTRCSLTAIRGQVFTVHFYSSMAGSNHLSCPCVNLQHGHAHTMPALTLENCNTRSSLCSFPAMTGTDRWSLRLT